MSNKNSVMIFFKEGPGWRPGEFVRQITKGKHKRKCVVLVGYTKKKVKLHASRLFFREDGDHRPKGSGLWEDVF